MPPPRRNPASDIDRFLMEVDRLRRKAADDARKPAQEREYDEVLPVEPVDEVLPVEPVAPPPVRRPPRDQPKPRPRQRPFDDVEVVQPAPAVHVDAPQAYGAAPVGHLAAPQLSGAYSAGTVGTVATIATVAAVAAPKAAGALTRLAVNPVATQVRAMLRRDNLRAALMLREVLGPPLCKRRRGR